MKLYSVIARVTLAMLCVVNCCEGQEANPVIESHAGGFFESQVLPIFESKCFECHSHEFEESSGGLMLDSLAGLQHGGARGPTIDQNSPQDSVLLRAIGYEDSSLQMPPDGALSPDEVQRIMQWADAGFPVPNAWKGKLQLLRPAADSSSASDAHWAYQLPQPQSPGSDSAGRTPIDDLLTANLEQINLQYAQRAERFTLIKRLKYDLLGLPPTFEEVARFQADPRSEEEAFAQLVDRWLLSPYFGERWARYWMDVARYADNKGYVFQEDREYPEAYRYRDWLVEAFNQDMPYSEFVQHQLAADLLPDNEANLPALGFLTLGRRFLNNRFDIIDDRLDVTSRGLMGLTLTCARCHDHKYDPISQQDYYALFGVFLNTDEPGGAPWPHRLTDAAQNRVSFVLRRGQPGNHGPQVPRRFVSFLSPTSKAFSQKGSGRLELAAAITAPSNPLTARVIANRIWLKLTGSSLVESPSDFGVRCPQPLQQPLLDHLALQLLENEWGIKRLIREIVLSDCYAQSSVAGSEALKADPTNAYYGRMNRRRLDFEALRDTILMQSGQLNQAIGGKSVKIDDRNANRRTAYSYIDRQNLPSIFRTFDMASPDTHSPRRAQTSVPQQGLFLLNSSFLAEASQKLGSRAEAIATSKADSAALDWLFSQILVRYPTDQERGWVLDFLGDAKSLVSTAPQPSWEYGYGAISSTGETLGQFRPLPHFSERGWQGGRQLPDSQLGWCLLTDSGGHPGNDLNHAVIRRWNIPSSGSLSCTGQVKHSAEQGDGVRVTVFLNDKKITDSTVQNATRSLRFKELSVVAGDKILFVTDCRTNTSHDSFLFDVRLELHHRAQVQRFESKREFSGPGPAVLDSWAQVAQALLLSNELAHID